MKVLFLHDKTNDFSVWLSHFAKEHKLIMLDNKFAPPVLKGFKNALMFWPAKNSVKGRARLKAIEDFGKHNKIVKI